MARSVPSGAAGREPVPPRLSTWGDDRGATVVEYALLLALIVIAALGAVLAVGLADAHSLHNTVTVIGQHVP